MSRTADKPQHLNVRPSQMEMTSRSSGPFSEDFSGKLQEAQSQLEMLQQQQAEVERQKDELQELNEQKEEFLHGQIELNEKLAAAISMMDREIYATRQELDELEKARVSFTDHLEKIDHLNPDASNNEILRQDLTRAISVLDLAEDEYDQTVEQFSAGRISAVFGGNSRLKTKHVSASVVESEFFLHFRNGFAHNLPLVLLGIIAMIVYLLK